MNLEKLYYLIIISTTVSVISMTVTKAGFFKPLRTWLKSKDSFIHELFSCPYCFSFYPAALFVALYYDKVVLTIGPMFIFFGNLVTIWDFLLTWFSIVAIATFISGFIYRSISQMD